MVRVLFVFYRHTYNVLLLLFLEKAGPHYPLHPLHGSMENDDKTGEAEQDETVVPKRKQSGSAQEYIL